MKFKDFITEGTAKKDTIVVLNGRMNPVTRGHEENVNGMLEFSKKHNADHLVIASHSHDNKKNPLTPEQKLTHLQRAFPGVNVKTSDKESPTIFHQLSQLHDQGYKHVVLASGADRTEDYDRIKDYNGKAGKHGYYNFKSITTASTGERQEGISGTDMRNHVVNNNYKEFKKNLPTNLSANDKYAKEIFNDVKTGMAPKEKAAPKAKPKKFAYTPVNEDYENPYRFDWGTPEGTNYMKKMTPGMKTECVNPNTVWSEKLGRCVPLREAYIQNDIFKLQEVVEAKNGDKGPIVFRGATYVTIKLDEGKTVKHWINDIKESTGEYYLPKPEAPVVVYKKKFSEQKRAALLMSKEQLTEMSKQSMEVEYKDYKTNFLHTSAEASARIKDLLTKTLNPKFVLQAIMATDQYLEIESNAKKEGFAMPDVLHNFLMKLSIAHDTLNLLGYEDVDLMYMHNDLKVMSDLSMHRDGTFANEVGTTVPMYAKGELEEDAMTSDYKIVIGKDGKKYKVRSGRIVTTSKKQEEGMENKYTSFRKKIQELYEPDPPTHNRDINFSPNKDVFHGVEIDSDEVGFDGKKSAVTSFKTFMNDPMNKKVAAEHEKDRQDVHRAQVEIGSTYSPQYKTMKKRQQLEP